MRKNYICFMILFPPAKINLGLNILRKRTDGYHDIESCMVPIPIFDLLEITPAESFEFLQSGIQIIGGGGENLCEKAFQIMRNQFDIPAVYIHLRKQIPIGAGLGGGSSDATHTLIALNQMFQLNLSSLKIKQLSAELGSDCPFFVDEIPQMATGRGEILSPIDIDLSPYYLVLLNPGIHVGTKEAYSGVRVDENTASISEIIHNPIEKWRDVLKNDFEWSVFQRFPQLQTLKESLYEAGAAYAAMSGSGSSVFGVFTSGELAMNFQSPHLIYKGRFKNQA
jgi:4-diphosphocytidyl-2-C-methyl-D-erythritol kinase